MDERSEPMPALLPLACSACGGLVPLADADRVLCHFCGASIAVPPRHRALRAASATDAARRATADALYSRLGRTPNAGLRACASVFTPGALLLGLFPASAIIGVLLLGAVLLLVDRLAPFNPFDVLSERPLTWWAIITGLVLAWAGTLLGSLARHVALDRQALQAALAARPPSRPGGPASCRRCAAPLDVVPGALGARCDFCGADNLVAIREEWIAAARRSVRRLDAAIERAVAELAGQRAATRHSLIRFAVGLTAGTALLLFLFVLGFHGEAIPFSGAPSYAAQLAGERTVIERTYVERDGLSYGVTYVHALASPLRFDVVPFECRSPNRCVHRFYVALRRGEHLRVEALSLLAGARVTVAAHVGGGWDSDDLNDFDAQAAFTPLIGEHLEAGEQFEVIARRSAWHRLLVETPTGGTGSLTISIAP
ncbi:MAG: hypothetical protein U1E76_18715 [Planctomycetota bacterium]